MNYKRIYDEFIKDRREKEKTLTGYTERHHILPRSIGGGDEPSNLIRLTPEDHFFAHLCLAKMHGGKLWAPVAFMAGGTRKDYEPIVSRKRYGWTLRAMGRESSGENARQYDWTIHDLEHRDGRLWSGTQYEMSALGIKRSLANMLIKGRVNSACGWFFKGRRPKFRGADFGGRDHMMYRPEVIRFLHLDGREFVGTQHDFSLSGEVSKSAACNLARGVARVANGWYVEGRPPVRKGRGARWFKKLEQNEISRGSSDFVKSQKGSAA